MPILYTASCHLIYIWKAVQWCKILCGLWGFRHSWIQIIILCHQEPVSCHLLALLSSMLVLFSVVSPQVVAPRGSGLLSNQLGSPRGLRAPLLGKFWEQSMDQVRACVQLEQVKRRDGVSHWPIRGPVLIPVSLIRARSRVGMGWFSKGK